MGSQRVGHDWATELNWTWKLKTTWMSFNGWMFKQILHLLHGVLVSNKKEWSKNRSNHLDKSQGHLPEWKKSTSQAYIMVVVVVTQIYTAIKWQNNLQAFYQGQFPGVIWNIITGGIWVKRTQDHSALGSQQPILYIYFKIKRFFHAVEKVWQTTLGRL